MQRPSKLAAPPLALAALATFAALAATAALIAARPVARSAPADARDWPVAVAAGGGSELFVAMQADVSNLGGIARLGPDCVPVATWRTGDLLDLAADTGAVPRVWALEARREGEQGHVDVARYAGSGARLAAWEVGEGARHIAVHALGPVEARELYVTHDATDVTAPRLAIYAADGRLLRDWDLPGEPRGVALSRSSRDDQPVYVAIAGPGDGGTLIRYASDGRLVWERPLDFDPAALDADGGQAVVVGTAPGGATGDGTYARYRDDGTVVRTWPLPGLEPRNIAASGGSTTWVLGQRTGGPGSADVHVLAAFDAFGVHQADCPNLPQPSVATPAPSTECPAPVPGAEAWRYAASGKVEGAPAIAADGTVYLATLQGLLYAVGCDGARRWLFDYREHSPSGFGAQAFHGSPAVDEEGTIYVGDDVVVPNYFFAIRSDGTVKWVQEYQSTYSQIDASPALAPDGHIFVAAHGWGGGVDHGTILVLHRDGRRLRPAADDWGGDAGPITDSPVVLADGAAAYLSPPYAEWVLPTGTPPTATPTPYGSSTPTATITMPTSTPPTAPIPGPERAWLPLALAGAVVAPEVSDDAPRAAGDRRRDDAHARSVAPAQPRPTPWVTQPVPARLRIVRAQATPDIVVDLTGLREPSSPATDGRDVWFTAVGDDGPRLLAYRTGGVAPVRLVDHPLRAGVVASPLLGHRDAATGAIEVALMGDDGTLVVLDALPDSGAVAERWARFVGTPARGAPALGDDGRIYAAAGSAVMALDRVTGETAWSLALDSPANGSLALAPSGMLYVPSEDGTLYAVGTAAGGLDADAAWPAFRRDARNTGAVP